jgi:hypothetical protein
VVDAIDNSNGDDSDPRRRLAGFWLLVGAFCLLASAIIYFQRSASMERDVSRRVPSAEQMSGTAASQASGKPAASPILAKHERVRDFLHSWLLAACLLLLVFMVGAYALRRWSRAYRAMLLRRPARPTPTPDIWKMHELPPEIEPSGADEEDQG